MLKNERKSQGAIEFVIIFGAAMFFFTIFFLVIYSRVSETNQEKEAIIIKNLALSIQDEINLAIKSTNGYYREFSVPETISSQDYYINITDDMIYIKTEKNAVAYPVEEIQGNIKKDVNVIKKENGEVRLN